MNFHDVHKFISDLRYSKKKKKQNLQVGEMPIRNSRSSIRTVAKATVTDSEIFVFEDYTIEVLS